MAIVLIAEDETILRFDLVDYLQTAGFKTIEARDGDEAISLLEQHPGVSCLFTDVQMPGSMDGIALADIVRRRWPEKAILIGSGKRQPKHLPDGAVFVRKPYNPAHLIDVISSLQRQRASK